MGRRYSDDSELMRQIGKAVSEARAESGMMQAEVAKICGINQSSLSRLEQGNGNVTALTLEAVANALGCRIEVRLTRRAHHKQ